MNLARPKPSTAPLDAAASALRAWLGLFSVWLVEMLDFSAGRRRPAWMEALYRRARRSAVSDLRAAASDLRSLLVMYALLRARLGPEPAARCHPLSAAPGFRRAALSSRTLRSMMSALIGPLHRGALRQRTERLGKLFDNLDELIARAVRLIERSVRCPHRVAHILLRARDSLVSLAAPPAPAADSS